MPYQPGDQVAYIPSHAHGDIRHPDVEFGFVALDTDGSLVFTRYWLKGKPGRLRTTICSEATDRARLVPHKSVEDYLIVSILGELGLIPTCEN